MKWDDHKPYIMFGPRHIRYCFPIERYVVSGNFGGGSHEFFPWLMRVALCRICIIPSQWLVVEVSKSFILRRFGTIHPTWQMFLGWLEIPIHPFSFLLLQFGTGIAVDRFQGQQEGGRCVGDKHSMKDLEPWAADVWSDLKLIMALQLESTKKNVKTSLKSRP